jgi:methyltransferase family protein
VKDPDASWPPFLFQAEPWQMTLGERAALEGLLATLRPVLAIEIGRAEGGSLARISKYSKEVHTIDLLDPDAPLPPHVHHHGGDSRQVLPALLQEFEQSGRNVDFVLLDGDHSTAVIQVDVENLLRSEALKRTVILLHDTMNEAARTGIENVRPQDFEKVRFVDLDLLAGVLVREPPFEGELWGGFGVIVVDVDGEAADPETEVSRTYRRHAAHHHDAYTMIERVADRRQREQRGGRRSAWAALRTKLNPRK